MTTWGSRSRQVLLVSPESEAGDSNGGQKPLSPAHPGPPCWGDPESRELFPSQGADLSERKEAKEPPGTQGQGGHGWQVRNFWATLLEPDEGAPNAPQNDGCASETQAGRKADDTEVGTASCGQLTRPTWGSQPPLEGLFLLGPNRLEAPSQEGP